MPGGAGPEPQAPPTRRQLREERRARETAAQTSREGAGRSGAVAAARVPAGSDSADTSPGGPAASPAARSRRQIREEERAAAPRLVDPAPVARTEAFAAKESPATPAAPWDTVATEVPAPQAPPDSPHPRAHGRETGTRPRSRARAAGWAPRAAVLVALGALTIAAPVTGFATAEPAAGEAVAVPTVQTQASVLALLDARDAANAATTAGARRSLVAAPGAWARAGVAQASRGDDRAALGAVAVSGANGTRAAVADPSERVAMPLAAGTYRVTSAYGYHRSPFGGGRQLHTGTDLAAPRDSPIYAVADGVVDYVGEGKDGRSSMIIVLKHEIDGQTIYTWHNHMYRDGLYVEVGQRVQAGDVIAGIGSNGNSTGPHLHFEVHTDDELTTTDPLAWLKEQGAVDISELR